MKAQTVRRNQQPAHKAPGRVEPRSRKSVYRSNSGTLRGGRTVSSSGTLTGGLTAFSRRPVLAEFRCVRGDALVAVQQTKRHVNQLLHGDLTANNDHAAHSDVGDSSVSRRGRVFREKDRPYVQSTRGLTSFSRKDNGEWKIHYVRRTRDVAGRKRKHQDRVKRKRNTMIEERSIMRSA